jgi:hypothetical protein
LIRSALSSDGVNETRPALLMMTWMPPIASTSANSFSVKLQTGRPMSPAIATIFERMNAS